MASKTEKMRQQEEAIKQKIVDGYRRGVCDKEGRPLSRTSAGMGHTNRIVLNFDMPWKKEKPLNLWPRDAQGHPVGDD